MFEVDESIIDGEDAGGKSKTSLNFQTILRDNKIHSFTL
jgi:hypothetical protein